VVTAPGWVNDGRHASRFRDTYVPDTLPRVVDLCVSCQRPMWTNLPKSELRGNVTVSGDARHCTSCLRTINKTGDNPQDKKGSAAERLREERAEDDPSWRDNPDLICSEVDGEWFAPEPFPEELAAIPADVQDDMWDDRHYVARRICGPCPVRGACRAAALERGWQGLWGGAFFTRTQWVDLLSRRRRTGPTIHATATDRKALERRQARGVA
jgi:hypothetical protein